MEVNCAFRKEGALYFSCPLLFLRRSVPFSKSLRCKHSSCGARESCLSIPCSRASFPRDLKRRFFFFITDLRRSSSSKATLLLNINSSSNSLILLLPPRTIRRRRRSPRPLSSDSARPSGSAASPWAWTEAAVAPEVSKRRERERSRVFFSLPLFQHAHTLLSLFSLPKLIQKRTPAARGDSDNLPL